MSESQERMAAVVRPDKVDDFLAICRKWDVEAAIIGEVNDTGRLTIDWRGERIVDVPPRTVAHEGPVYHRPIARPEWLTPRQEDAPTPERLARPTDAGSVRQTILQLIASPNLAAKNWVTDQYDRYVMGNTVMAQPDDAGVIRVDDQTGRGVALATDANGRYAALDPYAGAQLSYAEAYRNVAVAGAVPLAVTNCLNFGSPEDPGVMWQFREAVTGLADACLQLGTPVTGGNVSFYNQTGDVAIHPTPLVGVLGLIDDVARRTPMAWGADGDLIYVLGQTADEFGGSEWAHVVHGHLGGLPPRLDLEAERQLGQILVAGSRDGMFNAAHDVSDGGIVVALVEMALRAGVGARCWVPDRIDPFVFLMAESATRAVVVVPRTEEIRFTEMCAARGFAATRIGVVDSEIGAEVAAGERGAGELAVGAAAQALVIDRVHGETVVLPLEELRRLREGTLPALFG